MSLNSANVRVFRQRVDLALAELLPTTIVVAGQPIAASTAGGRRTSDFPDGGQATHLAIEIRVLKTLLPVVTIGTDITWQPEPGRSLPMRITAIADRPHDPSWNLTCSARRA